MSAGVHDDAAPVDGERDGGEPRQRRMALGLVADLDGAGQRLDLGRVNATAERTGGGEIGRDHHRAEEGPEPLMREERDGGGGAEEVETVAHLSDAFGLAGADMPAIRSFVVWLRSAAPSAADCRRCAAWVACSRTANSRSWAISA